MCRKVAGADANFMQSFHEKGIHSNRIRIRCTVLQLEEHSLGWISAPFQRLSQAQHEQPYTAVYIYMQKKGGGILYLNEFYIK